MPHAPCCLQVADEAGVTVVLPVKGFRFYASHVWAAQLSMAYGARPLLTGMVSCWQQPTARVPLRCLWC